MNAFGISDITRSSAVSAAASQTLSPAPLVAFSTPNLATWEDQAGDRLVQLLRLQSGWDGHQAARVSRSVVEYACNLLPRLVNSGVPAPFIAPLASGGLQLEWHRRGWDLEIEIRRPGLLYAFAREIATGAEWDRELTDNLTELLPRLDAIRE